MAGIGNPPGGLRFYLSFTYYKIVYTLLMACNLGLERNGTGHSLMNETTMENGVSRLLCGIMYITTSRPYVRCLRATYCLLIDNETKESFELGWTENWLVGTITGSLVPWCSVERSTLVVRNPKWATPEKPAQPFALGCPIPAAITQAGDHAARV